MLEVKPVDFHLTEQRGSEICVCVALGIGIIKKCDSLRIAQKVCVCVFFTLLKQTYKLACFFLDGGVRPKWLEIIST